MWPIMVPAGNEPVSLVCAEGLEKAPEGSHFCGSRFGSAVAIDKKMADSLVSQLSKSFSQHDSRVGIPSW